MRTGLRLGPRTWTLLSRSRARVIQSRRTADLRPRGRRSPRRTLYLVNIRIPGANSSHSPAHTISSEISPPGSSHTLVTARLTLCSQINARRSVPGFRDALDALVAFEGAGDPVEEDGVYSNSNLCLHGILGSKRQGTTPSHPPEQHDARASRKDSRRVRVYSPEPGPSCRLRGCGRAS